MTQNISNAGRIAAAESAICRHCCEITPDVERVCADESDAIELLQSLALWAECNGVCLRIPKPVYEVEEIDTAQ
jgi:hypothetical protein